MKRRRFLSILGATTAALSTAGCTTQDGDEPPTFISTPQSQDLSVGEAATDLGREPLKIATPTVQRSIITSTAGSFSVNRWYRYQYVVFDVRGQPDVEPTDFVIKRDEQLRLPPVQRQYVKPVTRTCSVSCIGLPVKTSHTDSAAVVYHPDDRVRAEWELGAEAVSLFEIQPRCPLQAVHLIDRDGQLNVRFTVENLTSRSAGFRAIIALAWLSDGGVPIGFLIPAKTTVTETIVPQNLQGISTKDLTVVSEVTEETRYIKIERA